MARWNCGGKHVYAGRACRSPDRSAGAARRRLLERGKAYAFEFVILMGEGQGWGRDRRRQPAGCGRRDAEGVRAMFRTAGVAASPGVAIGPIYLHVPLALTVGAEVVDFGRAAGRVGGVQERNCARRRRACGTHRSGSRRARRRPRRRLRGPSRRAARQGDQRRDRRADRGPRPDRARRGARLFRSAARNSWRSTTKLCGCAARIWPTSNAG